MLFSERTFIRFCSEAESMGRMSGRIMVASVVWSDSANKTFIM